MDRDRVRLERALEIYLRLAGFDRAARQARLREYCDLLGMRSNSLTADIHLSDCYFVAYRDGSGLYLTRDQFRIILQGLGSRTETPPSS
jgi:hypothetical protein